MSELSQLLRFEPQNEEAWMLAASLVSKGEERIRLINKGLSYLPGNAQLSRLLNDALGSAAGSAPVAVQTTHNEMDLQTYRIITLLEEQNQLLSSLVNQDQGYLHVKVEDIDMPFWAIAGFAIKWSIALIPAGIVIGFLFTVLSLFFRYGF